jgi:uncharacterized membrane protein
MKLDAEARRFWLLSLGATISAGFILLRATNLYGDPVPWAKQETWAATVLSFLNCEKYPPSLLFLMMTLGPALLLLGSFEKIRGPIVGPLTTFGRVPFFYYVAHLYLIHGLAVLFHLGQSLLSDSVAVHISTLGLGGVYLVWLCVLVLLFPLCRWFAALKQHRTEWWWSYI